VPRGKFGTVSESNGSPHCDHLATVLDRLAYHHMAEKGSIAERAVGWSTILGYLPTSMPEACLSRYAAQLDWETPTITGKSPRSRRAGGSAH